MIHRARIQVRAPGARYPDHVMKDIEASSEVLAVVLAWEYGRKMISLSGRVRVLNVALET